MHNDELELKSAQRAVGAILIGGLVLVVCIVGAILLAVFHDAQWALTLIFLLPGGYMLGFLLVYQLDAEDEAKAKIQRRVDKETERILREGDRPAALPDYVWVVVDNGSYPGSPVVTVLTREKEVPYYEAAGYRVIKRVLA